MELFYNDPISNAAQLFQEEINTGLTNKFNLVTGNRPPQDGTSRSPEYAPKVGRENFFGTRRHAETWLEKKLDKREQGSEKIFDLWIRSEWNS